MSNEQKQNSKGRDVVAYQKRVTALKDAILYTCERNMENTVWVIRRWLRDEMDLVNRKSED